MHKKTILVGICVTTAAILASCGGPKGNLTYEQVTAGHVDAIFDSVEKIGGALDLVKASETATLRLGISSTEATGTITLNASGASDIFSGTLAQSLTAELNASGSAQGKNGSANAIFDIFTQGSDGFFRLKKLTVLIDDLPEAALFADMAKGPFLDKWVKLPTSSDFGQYPLTNLRETITRNPRKVVDTVRGALKNNFPLVKTADLGFADGNYSYAVEFSGAKLIQAIDEISLALAGTGIEKIPADTQAELNKISGTGTLTINEKNKDWGSILLAFAVENQPVVTLNASNNQQGISVKVTPAPGSGSISLIWNRDDGRGTLEAKEANGKVFVSVTFKANMNRGNGSITGTATIEPNTPETTTITFDLSQSWKPDSSVKITAPTDSIGFEQILGSLMGGVSPLIPNTPGANQGEMEPGAQADVETLLGQDTKTSIAPTTSTPTIAPAVRKPRK